jgi:hypothetical protein
LLFGLLFGFPVALLLERDQLGQLDRVDALQKLARGAPPAVGDF